MSVNLLKKIESAYFSQVPFEHWKEGLWIWDLELIVPGGGGVQWGKFSEYFRWPNHSWTEFDFKDGKITNYFDGAKAWDGERNPKSIDTERFLIAVRIRNLVHDLVTGRIKILNADEKTGRFKLQFESGDEPLVTFDPVTGFLIRYEGLSKAMGRPNVSTFEWADYEVQEGIPIPRKQNLLLNGVVFQRRILKSFHMNPHVAVVAAAIILKDKTVLLARRRKGDHLEGFWEFPGGKIHYGETLEECLRRELKEELGVEVKVNTLFYSTAHEYPEKIVHLHFFLCEIFSGDPMPHESEELVWAELDALSDYSLPPADAMLINKLKGGVHNGYR